MAPYSSRQKRNSPEVTVVHTTSSTTDTLSASDPQQMHGQIKARLAMLQTKFDMHMRRSYARYILDYNRRARMPPSSQVGRYVSASKSLLATASESSTNDLKSSTYNYFQKEVSGLYRNKELRSDNVYVNEYDIPKTASANCITQAPALRIRRHCNKTLLKPKKTSSKDIRKAKRAEQRRQKSTNNTEKYGVDKRIRHIKKEFQIIHVVGWSGYKPSKNTTEPANHISRHSIGKY